MHITWHGQFLFRLTAQPQKNSQINIVIDPFDKKADLRAPKLKADILLVTHQDYIDVEQVSGTPFLINGPGEYDIKHIFIQGVSSKDKLNGENTIYTIETEDLKLCHLGAFGQPELTNEQLEKIGDSDILMVPTSGKQTLNSSEASRIINQIEPRIVIPMGYKGKTEGLNEFLKIMGLKSIEPQKKLIIKKKDLPQEMQIVVLEP